MSRLQERAKEGREICLHHLFEESQAQAEAGMRWSSFVGAVDVYLKEELVLKTLRGCSRVLLWWLCYRAPCLSLPRTRGGWSCAVKAYVRISRCGGNRCMKISCVIAGLYLNEGSSTSREEERGSVEGRRDSHTMYR